MQREIMPTGQCFDDSMEFLSNRIKNEPGAYTRYVLIHAMIRGINGAVHAHSWVEDPVEDCVWTAGIKQRERVFVRVFDQAAYRAFVGAHDITCYSIEEARQMMQRHKHPPPWEPRYRRLCGPPLSASLV